MKKLFKLSLIALFLNASCNVKEATQASEVPQWNPKTIYPAGSYAMFNGDVYKSTTATRGADPSQHASEEEYPMGSWRRSSDAEYQQDKRRLSVDSSGVRGAVTLADLNDVDYWRAGTVYHGNDLVRTSQGFFRNMWWNTDNNPDLPEFKNNHTDESGTTHWGPWVALTAEEALEHLENQQGAIVPPTEPEVNPDTEVTPPKPEITPPTGEVPSDTVDEFEWSATAIYLENDLAVIKGGSNRFFRSKWWNQNISPTAPYEYAWDSPWEEISETQFKEYVENGGVTPPPVKPIPPVKPPVTPPVTPTPGYENIQKLGYIQEWSWEEFPQEYRDALDAASATGNILTSNGEAAANRFASKINATQWNLLFPRRIGTAPWLAENAAITSADDYYSYENFKTAVKMMGDYAYLIIVALDGTSAGNETSFERNFILHKPTKTVRLISQSDDYFATENNEWLLNRPVKLKAVDYANFGSEGTDNDKARGVAGFLAHASHETSGSWATAPGWAFDKSQFPSAQFPSYITDQLPGELAWSLFFNEEVAYKNMPGAHYVAAGHKIFPPTPGKSYHGRGAFQLSWNYNYGLASAIFFGTSKVLLDRPELIVNGGVIDQGWIKGTQINGGTMAFLTSLMFWMTPQGAKPSQQDTMILNRNDGRYVQGTAKINAVSGLGTPGYGWTINIMNGGFEAGKSWVEGHAKFDSKVARRVKHYLFFTQSLGGNNDNEILDTVDLHPY